MKIREKVLSVMKGKEERIFSSHEIIDMVLQKFPDTNKSSVLPSDYCYNRINKDIEKKFRLGFHVFESLNDNLYKYLGQESSYTGPIYWKGKKVGDWLKGKITRLDKLTND
jgi:hypothetical protein